MTTSTTLQPEKTKLHHYHPPDTSSICQERWTNKLATPAGLVAGDSAEPVRSRER